LTRILDSRPLIDTMEVSEDVVPIIMRIRKLCLLLFKALTEKLFFLSDPAVTLSTLRGWRYPAFLINSLANAGTVGVHWRDIFIAYQMLPARLFFTRVRIASLLPAGRRGVLIYDEELGRKIACTQTIMLDKKYYLPHEVDAYIYPYFAYPDFYKERRPTFSLTEPRSIRLFFSGTVHNGHYAVAARFNILTRPEIIKVFTKLLKQNPLKAQIVVTDDASNNLAKHCLSLREFLDKLADSDFCLCPPGWAMPHCHNIIEAMSVGSIPVTNYHAYMTPPLRHGINCLTFDSIDDLARIVDSLPHFTAAEIEKMRHNVVNYYNQFLDARAVGADFLARIKQISTLVVNDEDVSKYMT
jgi:hypothetical protein